MFLRNFCGCSLYFDGRQCSDLGHSELFAGKKKNCQVILSGIVQINPDSLLAVRDEIHIRCLLCDLGVTSLIIQRGYQVVRSLEGLWPVIYTTENATLEVHLCTKFCSIMFSGSPQVPRGL